MADTNSKPCTQCGETKKFSEFHKRTASPDGLAPLCRTCAKAKAKAYNERNAERNLARVLAWQAANPDRVQAKRKAWAAANPDKVKKARRAWKKANPEKVRAEVAARMRANPAKRAALEATRRARKQGGGGKFTSDQIAQLLAKQRGCCAECGKKVGKRFHRDHITPVARGGSSDITNIQILCPSCNSKKGSKDPIEHAQALGRLL